MENHKHLMPTLGQPAPDFKGVAFFRHSFRKKKLADYKGKWLVLFFYPLDFTFVCPTEIKSFNNHYDEFKKNNCEVLGCSVDSKFVHRAWSKSPLDIGGIGMLKFPLLEDVSHDITSAYGCLVPSGPEKGIANR